MSLRDFHYSLRALQKNPAFAILAIVTIALAVGANTSVFTAVNGVLLKSFSFPDAERLVVVNCASKSLSDVGVSYPDYLDWRAEQQVFVDLAARSRSARPTAARTRHWHRRSNL
jgi:putative ABC transport system permease protein